MNTHNICFHGKIRKYQYFLVENKSALISGTMMSDCSGQGHTMSPSWIYEGLHIHIVEMAESHVHDICIFILLKWLSPMSKISSFHHVNVSILDKKNSADKIFKIFFLFFPETGFDISCKLSPQETICMKCQSLFSGKKNKKNIINLLSAVYVQRVAKINMPEYVIASFSAAHTNI